MRENILDRQNIHMEIEWDEVTKDLLQQVEMNRESFDELFLCKFTDNPEPSPYPDIKFGSVWESIYERNCPSCDRLFYGRKSRYYCLDCNKKGIHKEKNDEI